LPSKSAKAGDRDHLGVGRGHRGGGVRPVVHGGDDHRLAGVGDGADRGVEWGRGAGAIAAGAAKAHVHDVDLGALTEHPVEPADHGRGRTVAILAVQNLDCVEAGAGGDADDPGPVVLGGGDPGDVGAVPVVVVVAGAGGDAVDAAGDVQLRVVAVDPGVEDRDPGVDRRRFLAVDPRPRVPVRLDPVDPCRQGLGRHRNQGIVGDDHHLGRPAAGRPNRPHLR
jgi:hypothetical protein